MPSPPTQAWTIHPIAPDVRLRVTRPMPPLPASLDAEVSRLWTEAQTRMGGKLFNGRVFNADLITPTLVCGHWTEYRRIVAQMNRHDLFPLLGIRSLAVGGVIISPDGIVFGRRPKGAIYQANEWQLPPAGSVDPTCEGPEGNADFRAQFLTELQEELGLPPTTVTNLRPLCIVEHAGSHVLDLGIAAHTTLTAPEIHQAHQTHGNTEYAPLEIIPLTTLPNFLAGEGTLLNLQAPIFLRHAGVL